ncbi:MAG: hypothetical protein HY474_02230 [Candidatus Sungbacteria bacterium]|uniref:Uncharacterized protein n=1 Tax=Candidatus Sungiibacteriota bacterium TaxID=2750080 RepID=A0A932YVW8_9BACT|nr:hypothetical protein [Candidatus Sungbacteria bacterium]
MITAERINQFFSFLYAGDVGAVAFWLRLAAGVVSSALLAAIIVIALKIHDLVRAKPPAAEPAPERPKVPAAWEEVMAKIESPNPSDWHRAVILADAVFDGALKERGLLGETMGDRLKQLDRTSFAALDGAWEAHKIRNRIAHEAAGVLAYQEARRAVLLFGEALRELGYMKE